LTAGAHVIFRIACAATGDAVAKQVGNMALASNRENDFMVAPPFLCCCEEATLRSLSLSTVIFM